MAVVENRVAQVLLCVLGGLSILLALIGVVAPGIPSTPFILLAAWCFSKSSEKAHLWLRRQPILGRALNDWEKDRSISKRTKRFAFLMIAISLAVIWGKAQYFWVKVSVSLILLFVSVFIFTRPSTSIDPDMAG